MVAHDTLLSDGGGVPSSGRVKLRLAMETKWLGGSLIAWLAFGLTIVGNAITYGATMASMQAQIATLQSTVNRNREEALDRIKTVEISVSNVHSALSTLNVSIKVDVEVIKEQIKSINSSIQRMERDGRKISK